MNRHDSPERNLNDQTIAGYPSIKETPKPDRPFLIIIAGPSAGEMYSLQKEEVILGRDEGCDIVLADPRVSHKHAKIIFSGNDVMVIDLDSTNGTYINGRKITSHQLEDGEKIRVGMSVVLKFSYQDSVEEQFQKKLFDHATRDPLTLVYNRRYAMDRLSNEITYASRKKAKFALLLLDVDHFKKINDTCGHPAGDYVLQKMAKEVKEILRNEDILARYGGEEFIILLRDTDETQARTLAERLRRFIENLDFSCEEHHLNITVSIGMACYQDGNFDTEKKMIASADKALYRAKDAGRNRVECAP